MFSVVRKYRTTRKIRAVEAALLKFRLPSLPIVAQIRKKIVVKFSKIPVSTIGYCLISAGVNSGVPRPILFLLYHFAECSKTLKDKFIFQFKVVKFDHFKNYSTSKTKPLQIVCSFLTSGVNVKVCKVAFWLAFSAYVKRKQVSFILQLALLHVTAGIFIN